MTGFCCCFLRIFKNARGWRETEWEGVGRMNESDEEEGQNKETGKKQEIMEG